MLSLCLAAQERITLLFAGDLMQHQGQIDAAKSGTGYDYTDCFRYVKEEIGNADLAIGNLEVTLGGKPYRGYPAFSAPDEYLTAIRDAGFDVLVTANNHCLDSGKKGLERTVRMLDSLGIPHAGTYRDSIAREKEYPLILDKNGFRIALLNYTYGTNGIGVTAPNVVNYIDKAVIEKDICKARTFRPDLVIVLMHWGTEYRSMPDNGQKELAGWLIGQGVDHVIGSHPHVVQPMELRAGADSVSQQVVVYSLGNYISNMSAPHTDGGAMFKMEFRKNGPVVRLTDCGYSLVWTSRPVLSGKKNFVLYPAANPPVSITPGEANRLKIFVDAARKLFLKQNKSIGEYIF